MSSARTALRERVAALGRARRAFDAGRLDDAERILQDELARWPANRDAQALLAEVTRARAATPGHGSSGPAPPQKTGSEAWSSFEQRIRDRKAARLRDHIRASLEAGSPEAALQGLEELETVAPGVPLPEDIAELLRAQLPDTPAVHEPEQVPGPSAEIPLSPPTGTPGYLREMPSAPSVGPDAALEKRDAPQPQARPTTHAGPTRAPSVVPLSPIGPTSALDLFPATQEWESTVVDTPTPLEELPLRQRPHDTVAPLEGRARELPDDGSMRLRLAPGGEPTTGRSAPLRERGAHLLGLLLVVSSILALSGWAGYQLFKPATIITEAPVPESDATQPSPGAGHDTASQAASQPPATPPPQPSATETPETIGTAGGGSPSPDPATQLSAVPPATLPGVAPSRDAAAPASSTAASSPPDRTGQAASASRETNTTVARERTPSASPLPSPSGAGGQTDATAQLPQVGTPSAPPQVRTPQPTPEPVPPLAQERSEPATTATTEPAAPAPSREGGAESTAPPSAPGDAATTAAAEAGTSTRDADAMRGLIEGYLAGYNNLDAGGVRGVWPSVDQRALSRAFAQLRSQHLSFSRCEVRTTGDTGHGFCTGHAAWRPRVGGGEKIEQRVWRFDFAQRDDDWIIQRVNVER